MSPEKQIHVNLKNLRIVADEALERVNLILYLSNAMRALYDAEGTVESELNDHLVSLILGLNGKLSIIVESLEIDDLPF